MSVLDHSLSLTLHDWTAAAFGATAMNLAALPKDVKWWPAYRLAVIGIAAQFLALVRTLGEVFRIKYFVAGQYTPAGIEPFVGAALFTAVLAGVAVAVCAVGRHRTALTIALINIVALFVYKLTFM